MKQTITHIYKITTCATIPTSIIVTRSSSLRGDLVLYFSSSTSSTADPICPELGVILCCTQHSAHVDTAISRRSSACFRRSHFRPWSFAQEPVGEINRQCYPHGRAPQPRKLGRPSGKQPRAGHRRQHRYVSSGFLEQIKHDVRFPIIWACGNVRIETGLGCFSLRGTAVESFPLQVKKIAQTTAITQ